MQYEMEIIATYSILVTNLIFSVLAREFWSNFARISR